VAIEFIERVSSPLAAVWPHSGKALFSTVGKSFVDSMEFDPMGRMTKVMCSACGRDVLMPVVAYEELRRRERGRGLRNFRCDSCRQVAWRFDDLKNQNDMPEWKRMSLLPVGAQVRGRPRPYGGLDEYRTFRTDDPDDLPPDDIGNRIEPPETGNIPESEEGGELSRSDDVKSSGSAGESSGSAGEAVPQEPSVAKDRPDTKEPRKREDSMGRSRRSGGRRMYKTVCSRCSRPTRVPFKPTPARTIYCRSCMREKGMRHQ